MQHPQAIGIGIGIGQLIDTDLRENPFIAKPNP